MDKKQSESIKKDIEIAERFASRVQEIGIPLDELYIFGSRIRGDANKWSDLDVCVVSPTFGVNKTAELVLLSILKDKINLDIEAHPFSVQEFSNKYSPLVQEIKRTGIKVI